MRKDQTMGARKQAFRAGWRDGISHGTPDPRPDAVRWHRSGGEQGKYYRQGYISGAGLHISHSDARGYCTRCSQSISGYETFCGNCGAQVQGSPRRAWRFLGFLKGRSTR